MLFYPMYGFAKLAEAAKGLHFTTWPNWDGELCIRAAWRKQKKKNSPVISTRILALHRTKISFSFISFFFFFPVVFQVALGSEKKTSWPGCLNVFLEILTLHVKYASQFGLFPLIAKYLSRNMSMFTCSLSALQCCCTAVWFQFCFCSGITCFLLLYERVCF